MEENTAPEATPDTDPILASLGEESAPEEQTPEESGEVDTPAQEEATEQEEEPSEDTPESSEQPTEDTQEIDPEEVRKEEARRRYEEREKARAERQARVQTQAQQYVAEAEDEADQRLRNMEVQQYNNIIEHTENTLIGEFDRVKANTELQIFNPENKELFNQRLYDKAMRDYNAGYVEYDGNGNMVGLKGSLYQHLQETAELYTGAVKTGQFQQVRAERKNKINADPKPAATPPEKAKDPILDILRSD